MPKPPRPEPCQGGPLGVLRPPAFFAPASVRKGTPRHSRTARRRAVVLVLVHVAIFAHLMHWQLTGRTLSPLEPSEAMFTIVEGTVNAGFILFLLSLLATLVLGRFFCGWACHVVALQDLSAWILKRMGIRPRPLRSRLLMFVPLLAGLYMFVWPRVWNEIYGLPRPEMHLELTKTDFWETFPGPGMAILTFLACGFAIVYLLGAKGFCTYACPYGGFFGVIDRFSPGRIVVSDACKGCGHCTAVCTSNVEVHREIREYGMVVDPGCMKCQDCVSVCPEGALRFAFARPFVFAKRRRRAGARSHADFSPGEEFLLAGSFAVALFALRGLPDHLVAGTTRLWIGDEVPLLLAWALAAIAAFAVVLLKRLGLQDEVQFLGRPMKEGGALTRPGRSFTSALILVIALFGAALGVQLVGLRAHRALPEALAAGAPPGVVEEALEHVESALLFRPRDAFFHVQRARLLGLLGRTAEAIEPSLRAAELAPGHALALLNLKQLALNRFQSGEPAQAARLLEPVHRAEPRDAAVACALAEALHAAGETARALAILDAVLAQGAPDPAVLETRDQIAGR
jgi:NAD-dependent dihydropyrimidine dehydrogenase PreA subunit